MNTIKIVRNRKLSNNKSTYGQMFLNDQFLFVTVEQPWNNNLKGHSCFPVGSYKLLKHDSVKHGPVVSFHNPELNIYAEPNLIPAGVDGRSDCLIHSANYANELMGCIAPGMSYMRDQKNNIIGVAGSKVAMTKLEGLWGDRSNLIAVVQWDTNV
jgi:hypothetical protein